VNGLVFVLTFGGVVETDRMSQVGGSPKLPGYRLF
jgi:hypothetical protein